jgi:hypothetical protein
MSCTAGQPSSALANSYKVLWFPPDRPVEGNTIYVRPATDFELAAERDSVPASRIDD